MYPTCHLLQKWTPPRVGKATSLHNPRVFYPLRIRRRWKGQGLGMTSPPRSFRRRPLGMIIPPLPPPLPPPLACPSLPMVRGAGGGSAGATCLTTQTVIRYRRDLGSARLAYRPQLSSFIRYWKETGVRAPGPPSATDIDANMQALRYADTIHNTS